MSNLEIDTSEKIKKLRRSIADADAVIIGAGAGLSASAGFIYSGERFKKYFSDFIGKYPFWQATANNKNAVYACVNFGEAYCPDEIKDRAVCINADIANTINSMKL